jgi:hypothetical protein
MRRAGETTYRPVLMQLYNWRQPPQLNEGLTPAFVEKITA